MPGEAEQNNLAAVVTIVKANICSFFCSFRLCPFFKYNIIHIFIYIYINVNH